MNKREYAQANRTSRESRDELAQSMPCKEEEGEANELTKKDAEERAEDHKGNSTKNCN